MIIDCIGCLHGAKPKLEGGDLLIITGDLTARDTSIERLEFLRWLSDQDYKKKIFIAGNHDNSLVGMHIRTTEIGMTHYLCDSGTEILYYPLLDPPNLDNIGVPYKRKTLKIWGSPWTSRFEGINPHCCAFTGADDDEIAPHFELIPPDVDILITHGPPFAIRDTTKDGRQVGSPSLMAQHITRLRPKLWVFSHIHEGYGKDGPYPWSGTTYVNCSIMNEKYEPINKPIRIEL